MSKKQNPPRAKGAVTTANTDTLKKLKTSLGIIIAVFAFLLYAQSIGYFYTLDDNGAITNNKVTKQGVAGIPTIFTHNYWYGIGDTKGNEYRPLSMVLFAIEWQFIPANPHINRFINVTLFALTCWLLFQLLCTLFHKQNLVIPFVCTLLYAAHPIHTEVVNSIKSLDDILCFLLIITSILLFLKSIETNSVMKTIFGGICFLLALLSKETAISFLLILPLLLYVFTSANLKNILTVFVVLVVATGAYFLMRTLALETITEAPDHPPYTNSLFAAKDFISQQATAFYILLRYIILLIIPHPLSHDYSYNQIPLMTLKDPLALLGMLVYLAIGIYALLNIKKKNVLAFAILFYLFTLAPVANIFRLIGATMAERFLYMPSLGFCIVVALLLAKFTNTELIKSKFINLKQFFLVNIKLFMIITIIAGLYSFKTLARSQDWKNNSSLFGADAETVPNSARAHSHNAIALLEDQYPAELNETVKQTILDKSIEEFKKGMTIYPEYALNYDGIGEAYMAKKDYKNATYYFELLLSKFPDEKLRAYKSLMTCYDNTNQIDKQISCDDSVIKYEPANTFAHINKGKALGQKGDYTTAIEEFEKAVSISPNETAAYKNLGVAYGYKKEFTKAIESLNKAASLDPNDPQVPMFLGVTYQNMGDSLKAKEYFASSQRLNANQKK